MREHESFYEDKTPKPARLEDQLRQVITHDVVAQVQPGSSVDRDEFHQQLNGKKTGDITRRAQVFDMNALPADAKLHPSYQALAERERRRALAQAEGQTVTNLPAQGEVYTAPKPPTRQA